MKVGDLVKFKYNNSLVGVIIKGNPIPGYSGEVITIAWNTGSIEMKCVEDVIIIVEI